jgi:hypothetical protein
MIFLLVIVAGPKWKLQRILHLKATKFFVTSLALLVPFLLFFLHVI